MSAPFGFITVAEVLNEIQATLAVQSLDVDSPWETIADRATRASYADIRQALARRGFTGVQIDAWDDGAAYQADQALFWALVRGGATKDYDPKLLALLDRRKDLMDAVVTIGGVIVAPATVAAATAVGAMDTTQDNFSLADDDLQTWYRAGEGPLVPPPCRR